MSAVADVCIVGGGLAGCEAAFQLCRRGHRVTLYEAKPLVFSAAHSDDNLAELVCSNSLKSERRPAGAALLKAELRSVGSLLLDIAEQHRVPAGSALAVDRKSFSAAVTAALRAEPAIEIRREVVSKPPARPCLLASGPLTAGPLADWLAGSTGSDRLHFYDAIAPIVSAQSLDRSVIFSASRREQGEGDYLNVPLDEPGYRALVEGLKSAEQVRPHSFEDARYFQACQPIERLAGQGDDTLAFGTMRPVGLVDPRTGRRPFAVIQLRREDAAGTAYNLVGCQTRMKQAEQRRVFRALPGLGGAEFLRYGSVHRNTYVDGPRVLQPDLSLKAETGLFLAGTLCGAEGYVEAMATGGLAALFIDARERGRALEPPPLTTALGALLAHVTGRIEGAAADFSPSNFHFGLVPPLDAPVKGGRRARREAMFARALEDLESWLASAL